jgi:hypothetical protein
VNSICELKGAIGVRVELVGIGKFTNRVVFEMVKRAAVDEEFRLIILLRVRARARGKYLLSVSH